jgi:Tol biopolymer transport system component/imidazolonepropionase-like amidohydrolase
MESALVLSLVLVLFGCQATPAKPDAADKSDKPDVAADINTPRADARHVTFEVHEGTWMSLDVSPDGKTIVFDLLGDLYAMPIGGGEAHALTKGPAFDCHPRFSPDGKAIAFTSDRGGNENVWLMGASGENPRPLTSEKDAYVRSAAWTPDGNYLVARRQESKRAGIPPVELWMFHVHGGAGVKLVDSDKRNCVAGPVVSPDGRYIYYASRQARFDYVPDLSNGLWNVERFDRVTGDTIPLTSGIGGAVRPAISPDGKTMTFVSRRDDQSVLVARDLVSGAERILVRGVQRDEQEGFGQLDLWPAYAFTPDGESVVYTANGKIQRVAVKTGATSDVPFTVKAEHWLAPRVAWEEKCDEGPIQARILRWPNQSPDGKWIVFDAFGRVWLQAIDGGKASGAPRRLTTDDAAMPQREYAPAFSPDGQWIAYVTWKDSEGGHVWKAPAPGGAGAPQKLTKSPGHYMNPAWSPSGDRLVLVQGTGQEFRGRQPEEEQAFQVSWIPASGGDPTFVTAERQGDSLKWHPQAFWNRDGSRIFLREPVEPAKPTDDPKSDLVSVRLDGTDKRRHLRFPAVADLVPSPDEQWIAFTSRDNVYVTAMPGLALKDPPEISLKEAPLPVWRLSDEAGEWVAWADGGRTITWGLGNVFHRVGVSAAIDFVEEQRRKAEEKKKAEAKKGGDADKKDDKKEEKPPRVPKSEEIAIVVEVPRFAPKGSFVLRGARVVTMKGDEVLESADVVVTDGRIAAVGTNVAVPAGAKEVDARGKTIIPGLIDTHAHLHYSGFEMYADVKWEYAANLAYGVTTVYDPSAPSLDVFAQAEMVESGAMIGPRVYSSGDVLYGGQQSDIFAEVNDQDDARRQVKRMKAYGARLIKVYQQPRREQRMWFAEACREEHMLLTAEGAGELYTDLTMATDGYTAWEHALPIELRDDAVQLIAKSGTHYTPTLLVAYGGPWGELYYYQTRNPHDDAKLGRFVPHFMLDHLARRHPWIDPSEYFFPTVARGCAAVVRAGGNVSLGAHGQLQGLGPHWELWAMAGEGGKPGSAMTPMQAIRASTIAAADKIGFAPDLGSIEPGKLADLIVLDANPLDDIHATAKAKWVVKQGVLYDAETLREEWPERRDLPAFFWKPATPR